MLQRKKGKDEKKKRKSREHTRKKCTFIYQLSCVGSQADRLLPTSECDPA